ncbi:transglycosylase family protein [Streptomyces fructofermentans]|uniref:transglycosylase family protein n=1 Tax=Streptomyces fructofermentans TaxID=152141 RepID=UPI0037937C54
MLSGNGRHRRPRQAPALLVAAGVAGSAIAIPLLGASGASAASGTTWDAVAECESGGSWSADTGNGYYGGLQMTQDDWDAHGGLDYAPTPDQASRSQQIAVAEKILADEGNGAWTTCGLVAGLPQDSDSADVDTGLLEDVTGSGDSSKSTKDSKSDKSESSTDEGETSVSGSAGVERSGTSATVGTSNTGKSDKSSQEAEASGETGEDASVSGRHRGGSADEAATESRAGDYTGRHASRSDSESRIATDGAYTVRSGDSLWGIADSLDLEDGWGGLYDDNKESIGSDPNFILPGQSLEVDDVESASK